MRVCCTINGSTVSVFLLKTIFRRDVAKMTQTENLAASDNMANLKRKWIHAPGVQEEDDDGDSFTLLNYNILADCHFQEDWYPYCPEGYRKMADRHRQLFAELKHHDADIICLQEVGPDYFAKILQPALFDVGYLGSFFNKGLSTKEGGATFYKWERFCKVEERGVLLSELITKECAKVKLPESVTASVADYTRKDNIIVLTKLQDHKTKSTVSVGNTHLLFEEYRNIDITALQVGVAINALVAFAGGPDQAHILCGDFNQEPMMIGYQLLENGILDEEGKAFIKQYPIQTLGGQNESKCLLDILPHCYCHESCHLQSAYKSVKGEEVPFSNYDDYKGTAWPPKTPLLMPDLDIPLVKKPRKVDFLLEVGDLGLLIAALDYQWFSSSNLRCVGTLEMVDEGNIQAYYACPNIEFPSDHMSLLCQYQFVSYTE